MPSLVESVISLEVGAQEPWQNDVKLFQPYAMEQILLPDNANCLAVQAFLHMCGLPFQIEHRANAEFMSPSGKVPFIKCGAFVVSELEAIVQFVVNKGITLTNDLLPEQKSDMRAYMSIIHTVLVNAELYICWCDKKTYNEVTKPRNGSVYPWPLNHFQTWSKKAATIKKLKLLGWYQKSMENVYEEVENCCQALSERLEGKEFFFGSKPTQLDALLYGHFSAILSTPDCCDLFKNIINGFSNLLSHCKRIRALYGTHVIPARMTPQLPHAKYPLDTTVTNTASSQLIRKNVSLDADSPLNDVDNIASNGGLVVRSLTATLSQLLETDTTFLKTPLANDGRIIEMKFPGVSASRMFNSGNRSVASENRSEPADDLDVNLCNAKSNTALVNDEHTDLVKALLANLFGNLSVSDENGNGEVVHENLDETVENISIEHRGRK